MSALASRMASLIGVVLESCIHAFCRNNHAAWNRELRQPILSAVNAGRGRQPLSGELRQRRAERFLFIVGLGLGCAPNILIPIYGRSHTEKCDAMML